MLSQMHCFAAIMALTEERLSICGAPASTEFGAEEISGAVASALFGTAADSTPPVVVESSAGA
jgi:hypothetical protein